METAEHMYDALWLNVKLATLPACSDGAIAVKEGRIAWLGERRALPSERAGRIHDCDGAWLTPGLIDCHTHLVYAGNRAQEFARLLNGETYAQIAASGGGIAATVRATRAAGAAELLSASDRRLEALCAEGVTTIEIKSGYGLDLPSELRLLRVARELGARRRLRVRTTFLGAHSVPPEYAGRADAYVRHVCDDMLPAVAGEGLADAVDAFCETIGFSVAQTELLFERARALGLPVKLHADQLSDSGGGQLVAKYGGLSADHLEYASEDSVRAMADAGVVAVLLPGAFYFLREQCLPPIGALRAHGVPMAIATDCNPGTSPCTSLLLMMNMACTLFRMTPDEALLGVTAHAARALGLGSETGCLAVGLSADFALWRVQELSELCYAFGANPCVGRVYQGEIV